jgi:CRISPR/Cas system-associated exonuclease Cas4 (RecB family)
MATNFMKQMLDKEPVGPINTKELIKKIETGYLIDQGSSFKTKKTFSPSSLVYGNGACARYWFLAFTGGDFVSNNDAYAVANMSSGTMAHERIQKAMEDSGILVEKEKRIVSQDPPIFGFVDAILQWGEDQLVGEIKTMREEAFSYRKFARPPNYHLMQLIIYMKVLARELGVLIYENKNSHELHAIPVEMNDEYKAWGEYAFDWMRTVRKQWESGEIPKKTYRSNSKVCKTCPLSGACVSADKGTIKIEPLEYLA